MVNKTIALHAEGREITGKKVKKLRQRAVMPAVVYGRDLEPSPISIDLKEFKKVFAEAGTSALVDLTINDAKPIKVLLHEPQTHYLNGEPIHVDFYAVKMTEKIETAIPITFVGVSPAVEEMEGNFISNKDELNIRCLPGDLIPGVEVDLTVLKTFDDQVRVKDIQVPETVEVTDDPEDVVCLVAAPISEEELEAELTEDTAAEEAAVAELGAEEAAEGEEKAEGETAEAEASPEPETKDA
ncbi:MAG: 50S ribosomal protein L25 [Candidatus Berkelbacteria bacterium]|nr:MAG: 50S ribosomal protein L25 [Candidatus Berkelbacteria bacterium]QQG52013.1 MAG: 50S ribosomal protein L25 [Candidatus Berkelbacteria bacterium]